MQLAMYAEQSSNAEPPMQRLDDWSAFGLRREGNILKGPIAALEQYMNYRKELKQRAQNG